VQLSRAPCALLFTTKSDVGVNDRCALLASIRQLVPDTVARLRAMQVWLSVSESLTFV